MNAGIQNLVISLGLMQGLLSFRIRGSFIFNTCCTVARKIPFDDPQVLNYVRIGYVSAQVIALAIYYYISTSVRFLSRLATLNPL